MQKPELLRALKLALSDVVIHPSRGGYKLWDCERNIPKHANNVPACVVTVSDVAWAIRTYAVVNGKIQGKTLEIMMENLADVKVGLPPRQKPRRPLSPILYYKGQLRRS